MTYVHSSVVEASTDEVFNWHSRPGALDRLAPPWQPVRVRQEAHSLRDGQAVLGLPGGLRWVATHRPDGYQPPHQFVDQLTSMPLSALLSWRHTHRFAENAGNTMTVTDIVESRLPDVMLSAMFEYRHAQLAADLASCRWARDKQAGPLTVAITGSSGLIGTALSALLSTGGHRVIRLVRRPPRSSGERQWHPQAPAPTLLRGTDAVVHLAGASLAGRFTPAHRSAVRETRVGPTRRLAELAAATAEGPGVFVSASAIGLYGPDHEDNVLDERSERGTGFLADVVADWEAATDPARSAGLRTVQMRTGIALSPRGGILRLLLPLFAAGLGGRLGDGRQWLSWIGLDDLCDLYLRALVDPAMHGPLNAVAPNPVRNDEYTRTLARVLRRPAMLPVPAFGPRLLLGADGARELAFASQRVSSTRLTAEHRFRSPELEPALRHLLGRARAQDGVPSSS